MNITFSASLNGHREAESVLFAGNCLSLKILLGPFTYLLHQVPFVKL
ncbi:hypothetical protein HID58_006001 [Brassica napus]|uniref:Uncharacterized protein n=1 Tax=Brassica napus TaxID=3708 RepID=A0ABQ8EA69_BRANA|nr:hypothetical protein HID58_006001 [Brassica napus]